MERRGFVAAGTWCLDRNITVDRWPSEDMAVIVRAIEPAGGGPACNFAVDLRRLDPSTPVEAQGLLGRDAEGDFLLRVAIDHGIDVSAARRTDDDRTEVTDAYRSAQTGRRTHILFPGVAGLMTPDHFDFSRTQARYLHIGLPGLHALMDAPWGEDANGWVTVLKRARDAGMETNLELVAADEAEIRRLALPCLPWLTTLVVNDHEIGAMAGLATVTQGATDARACEEAARRMLDRGAMELVAVHFTAGAVLVSRDGEVIHQPSVAIPDAERKGANGAGDAFAAGFFHGRQKGWSRRDCLKMGHAAAAACLRATDTYSTVESAEACLALAAGWGWREA